MADSTAVDLADVKAQLRKQAKRQRADAAAGAPDAADRLRQEVLAVVPFPEAAVVSGFWPMGDEIDVLPTLTALHGRGHPIGLPTMQGKARPLVFRRWQPGDALVDGGFGTSIPPETAPEVEPQVLLVPLLAFDRNGYRLGYGGGFYDRTLARLRGRDPGTLAVGVAYAGQEVDMVPHDDTDQRLDRIVTEAGPIPLAPPADEAG